MEDVTEPEGGGCVENEDVEQVVNLLDEVVRQGEAHFEGCQKQQPDLDLIPRLVGLLVPGDVLCDVNVEKEGLDGHKDLKEDNKDLLHR